MNTSLFNTMGEPSRFQIIELLKWGPLTVSEISERLELRQPQVSKHLRVLLEAGIVQVQAEANRRIYQLRKEPFQEMDEWLKSLSRIWEVRFHQLDQYLKLQQEKRKNEPERRLIVIMQLIKSNMKDVIR